MKIKFNLAVIFSLVAVGLFSSSSLSFAAVAAPTEFVATPVTSTQVNLSWKDVGSGASYIIERSATNAKTGFSQIDSVNAGVRVYSDMTVTGNKVYWYRVKATSTAGDSVYSKVDRAQTPATTGNVFYISPSGIDSANCSNSTPCKTFAKVYSLMQPGDTLVAKDGVYSQQSILQLLDKDSIYVGPPSGTSARYTRVIAEHDGGVIMNGAGFIMESPPATARSFIEIRGIVFRQQGRQATIYGLNHVKLIRCGFEDSSDGNAAVLNINGRNTASTTARPSKTTDILVEECFAWGSGRYKFATYVADRVVFRRTVARFDRVNASAEPMSVYSFYSADSVDCQNCISIDGDKPDFWFASESGGSFSFPSTDWPGRNSKVVGSIALNVDIAAFVVSKYLTDIDVANSVAWHVRDGIFARDQADFDRMTFGDVYGPALYYGGTGLRLDDGASTSSGDDDSGQTMALTNSVLTGVNNATPVTNFSPMTNNTIYPQATDPKSIFKYVLRTSDAATTAQGKGAEIIKRIGVSGTLYGEKDDQGNFIYNKVTDEDLWPFPYEDVIQREMKRYTYASGGQTLSGNRGFAVDGQTLTNYIWGYLGNAVPAEFSNNSVEPNPIPAALGATYYVATNGNDNNNGSSATPWRTLQKAADTAVAGDTVIVRPGNYAGMKMYGYPDNMNKGGTLGSPITFIAGEGAGAGHYSTSGVTINSTAPGLDNAIFMFATRGYYIIKGFNVQGTNKAILCNGMGNDGRDTRGNPGVQIINNKVTNAGTGIFSNTCHNILVEGNSTSGSSNEHGIYVNGSNGYTIRNNIAFSNNWDGIHTNIQDNTQGSVNINGLIEGNIVYSNNYSGMDLTAISYSTIRNNLSYGNGKHGIVIQDVTAINAPASNNNVVVNNTFDVTGAWNTNTAYAVGFGGNSNAGNSANTTIFNNILVGGVPVGLTYAGGTTLASTAKVSNNITNASGLFVNQSTRDYHLKSGASAINAGVASFNGKNAPTVDKDNNARPQGGAYDAGAYEYMGTTPVTPPSITTQPVSQTVNAGSSVTFSVAASGSAPLSYQWKKNGADISGATNASYNMSSVTTAANGTYAVTVKNSAGEVTSSTVTLTVSLSLSVTTHPQDKTISTGQTATFTVVAAGTAPLSYQWQKDGVDMSGAASTSYTTPVTTAADNGNTFRVQVRNAAGSIMSNSAVLIVNPVANRPPVLATVGNKAVAENSALSFVLSATEPDGNSLTYSASNLPSGATFNASTKTFNWTPSYTQAGSYPAVHFEVSDGNLKDSEDITITVNDGNRPPDLAAINSKTIVAGSNLNFTLSAVDADNDILTYSASGLPSGATFNASTKTFDWTPTVAGTFSNIVFNVSDGKGGSDSEIIAVTVTSNTPVGYILTAVINGGGTVTKSPDKVAYQEEAVTLTATPNTGYQFIGWSKEGETWTDNPTTITVDRNKTITANFQMVVPTVYALSVNFSNGSVSKSPDKANYNSGETVQLTATPNNGYEFSGWSADVVSMANPLNVSMDKSKNITANFSPKPQVRYLLSVTAVNGGSVTKDPNQADYPLGTKVSVTAKANTGYQFTGWSGDMSGTTNPATVTMDGNKNITANFKQIVPGTPVSLWSSSVKPRVAADPETSAVELGLKFKSDVAGNVTGVRFYKSSANKGTHVGRLWTKDGKLLGSVTFANETKSGWQKATFASPIAIEANTTYVISYSAPKGRYADDQDYFANKGVDSGPLHALRNGVEGPNGVYSYGTGVFPKSSYNASNYWVDVIFVPNP